MIQFILTRLPLVGIQNRENIFICFDCEIRKGWNIDGVTVTVLMVLMRAACCYCRQLPQWSSEKWSPVGPCVTVMTSGENHKKYVGCQSLKFIITTSIIYCCYSPNEHKYISDVMILSERKHFSIRSSQLIQWVDQFIIATYGNIQMKNISFLFSRKFFWKISSWKTDLITAESCTRSENSGDQLASIPAADEGRKNFCTQVLRVWKCVSTGLQHSLTWWSYNE